MKRTLWVVWILGVVALGLIGCSKEEAPVQKAVTEASGPSAQEKMVDPLAALVAESVPSAVQSSTQALVREGSTITDGVTSSAQSSTQDLAREGSSIVGGVTSAVQSSTQDLVRKEGELVGQEKV